MARRLAGLAEVLKAKRCFMTLHTGERVYYRITSKQLRDMKCAGGIGVEPMLKIAREDDTADIGGYYPVKALWFELANGEIVK